MEIDKQMNGSSPKPSEQVELCNILVEIHQAYWEDVLGAGMTYEDFVPNFFGTYKGFFCKEDGLTNGYKTVNDIFNQHQPIIEHRFKSSAFVLSDAECMMKEFEHCNSLFDRSLLDIQLRPIIPRLEHEDVMRLICKCANTTALFHCRVVYADMMAILTGTSEKDYGIYNVSHFAYFMKKLETQALTIQHWQSMVWNLSRIVYRGKYLNQHLISSTVHNISALKRRPWQYDSIDSYLSEIRRL